MVQKITKMNPTEKKYCLKKTYINLEKLDRTHDRNYPAEEKMVLQTRMHRPC